MIEHSTAAVFFPSVQPVLAVTVTRTVRNDFELTEKLPEQAYFWMSDWQKAERQADKDIKAGRARKFSNAEEAITYLRSSEV